MKHFLLILGILLIVIGGLFIFVAETQSLAPTGIAIVGIVLVGLYVISNWQQVARRSTFFGLNAILMSLAFVAILSVVYLIAQNREVTWDFTPTGKYTLDPQTAKILENLEQPVDLLLFFSSNARQSSSYVTVTDLLDEYKRHSDNLDYETIDPEKEYERAIEYAADLNSLGQPTIIAEMELGGKTFREKAATLDQEGISNAIMKVSHREPISAYFLVGNYEKELNGETLTGLALLNKFLGDENIQANELRLGPSSEVPDDADIIAVVGPEEDLSDDQLGAIKNFVLKGGGVFFALDPGEFPNIQLRMRELGFELPNKTVIEMEVSYRSIEDALSGRASASPTDKVEIATFDAENEITKQLSNSSLRFTTAREIETLPVPPDGITMTDLAKTADGQLSGTNLPRSWATSHPERMSQAGVTAENLFDPDEDNRGPVAVAVAAEVDLNAVSNGVADPDNPEKKGKIVMVGDSDFLTNVGLRAQGGQGGVLRSHHDFALNAFNWLAGQVDLITIREKEADNTSLILDDAMQKKLSVVLVWVIPAVIAAIGFIVVLYRRLYFV
ncbi:MAG: GldG family protein [Candidatus Omnitrophica bacterium]|nr:GldG family protein [Candidatus Omnitrophota bacterium]MCA9434426.1 GldG family protein [Candidatus Omnitrophota bacterium]